MCFIEKEEKMELNFRNLRADEIDCRICTINKGGVILLLYKDARADQIILDEKVGVLGWQRHHLRDNANCIVAIWDEDKKQWIEKEDTGVESFTEKEKGLASDSFKRACTNFGIGRELYTAPDIFIPKDKLSSYNYDEATKKGVCYDKFRVKEIEYVKDTNNCDTKQIKSVVIEISDVYKKSVSSLCFSNTPVVQNKTATTSTQAKPSSDTTTSKATTSVPANTAAPSSELLADDEIILMGNCRKQKYGDVKDTKTFLNFLNWAKKAPNTYDGEARNQFERIKQLAERRSLNG